MACSVFKRLLSVCLVLCMLAALAACSSEPETPGEVSSTDTVSVSDTSVQPAEPEAEPEYLYSDGGIHNSGFEMPEDGYWVISSEGDAVSIDTGCACEETASLRLGGDGEYSVSVVQHIKGLKPGYYYLEGYTLNEGNQDFCYLYGKGSGQGECMTSLPRTIAEGEWIKVTVRGIEVKDDGLLEIGFCSQGEGQSAWLDSLSLRYENDQTSQYESLFGGAISWLDWVEDLGGRYYYETGEEGDAIQIMAENGCNFVRLELYNNPGDYINASGDAFPAGYKDADAIFDLAVRAREKGMKIQLSFMYSDYWGNDAIPSDWMEKIEGIRDEAIIGEILTECLYDFTKGFMQRLADAGIYPEYVSLGNEMQSGILLPYGCTYSNGTATKNFTSFMDAGYRAVKEVSPSSQVVLHIACNADDMFWESGVGTGRWFFDICEKQGIKYDIIGTSYYPYWAQTNSEWALKKALDTGDLVEWCNMMIDTYDKDILIMESGINWGIPGQLSNNGAYRGIYKYTPEDQRDFMYELINAIKSVKDGRCIGDLYWDPVLVRQPGVGWAIQTRLGRARENCVETTTFFDYDHIALPVLDAYRYNLVGGEYAAVYGCVSDSSGSPLAEKSFTLSFDGSEYSVTTDRCGGYYIEITAGKGTLTLDETAGETAVLQPGDRCECDFIIG